MAFLGGLLHSKRGQIVIMVCVVFGQSLVFTKSPENRKPETPIKISGMLIKYTMILPRKQGAWPLFKAVMSRK